MRDIRRATITYDGSSYAQSTVTRLPVYPGLYIEIIRAGDGTAAEASLTEARKVLARAGIKATTLLLSDTPEEVILRHLDRHGRHGLITGSGASVTFPGRS